MSRMLVQVSARAVARHAAAQQAAPAPLRVITFDGGWNLPLWAAQRQGFFEAKASRSSSRPRRIPSCSSRPARRQLGHRAGDDRQHRRLPGRAGRGEDRGQSRLLRVHGQATGGSFRWSPARQVKSIADLKGKTLSVDAMATGFAFVLRELVARGGLAEADVTFVRAGGTQLRYRDLVAGKHDATLLRTPFELLARERGLKVLATARIARRVPGHGRLGAPQLGERERGRAGRLHRGSTGRGVDLRSREPRKSSRRCSSPISAT